MTNTTPATNASATKTALLALRVAIAHYDTAGLAMVHDWRRQCERRGITDEAFDRVAWELVNAGKVALHHHDYPKADPNHTKWLRRVSKLDGKETFFHAVALR